MSAEGGHEPTAAAQPPAYTPSPQPPVAPAAAAMTDSTTGSSSSSSQSTSAAPLREETVATAVQFLTNDKVRDSPLSRKLAFLERKGLTPAEIEAALERAGVAGGATGDNYRDLQPGSLTLHHTQLAPPPPPPQSWTSLVVKGLAIAGAAYGAAVFAKKHVLPRLGWKDEAEEARMQQLAALTEAVEQLRAAGEVQNTAITAGLGELREATACNAEAVQQLGQRLTAVESASATLAARQASGQSTAASVSSLDALQRELADLRSLVLSPKTFPTAKAPQIPQWQRRSISVDAVGAESAAQNPAPAPVGIPAWQRREAVEAAEAAEADTENGGSEEVSAASTSPPSAPAAAEAAKSPAHAVDTMSYAVVASHNLGASSSSPS